MRGVINRRHSHGKTNQPSDSRGRARAKKRLAASRVFFRSKHTNTLERDNV